MPAPRLVLSIIAILMLCRGTIPAAEEGPPGLEIRTRVSFTTNLVHWVDNLAGTSVGKTRNLYLRYWQKRFGPPTEADHEALRVFAGIRRRYLPLESTLHNEQGCLPMVDSRLGWHQRFLAEAMQADSIQDLARRLAPVLGPEDRAALMASLEHFRPRFKRVFRDVRHVHRFESRFDRFLDRGELPGYLNSLATFFGVDLATLPPMRISFIALPADGPTHAEADGDDLLIEIRPDDDPRDQIQVVAHEASHFLMRRMSPAQLDGLALQLYSAGQAGSLVWRYIWEGIPTALGQGLAEEKLSPETFSMRHSWYHIAAIDRFAKIIYPVVRKAAASGATLHDGVAEEIVQVVGRSELFRRARAAESFMISFQAAGPGLEPALRTLRQRLAGDIDPASFHFSLDDPEGRRRLQGYSCLGGIVIATPDQLVSAAGIIGGSLFAPEMIESIRQQMGVNRGVIAVARDGHRGPIVFLVPSEPQWAGAVVDSFTRLRGLPPAPLLVP